MTRENYNPDQIYIGDFKGLATAGSYLGADPSYLQTLTNAYVTKDGRIRQRSGSSFLYAVGSSYQPELFQFSFAGERFILHRFGTDLAVYRVVLSATGQPITIQVLAGKTNVWRTQSANEPATYAVRAEGQYCHVLVATASTTLIDVVLTYRDFIVSSITATTAVGTIGQYFSQNNVSQDNSKVFTGTDVSPTTAIANVGNQLTLTWASRPPSVVVDSKLRLFTCFWLRGADASYYPGSALYGTGLRRNTVALDVNVEVPETLSTNYIYNEPVQDLDYETYRLYDQTITNATRLNKVTNRQPLSVNDWDFSDGSYRAINTQLTNRTPNYVAFGGLQSANQNTRIGIARLRTILLSSYEYPSISDMAVRADVYTSISPVYHTFDGTVITTGQPKYFSVASSSSSPPGVNADAVVELIYLWNGANASNGSIASFVDISNNRDAHIIGDGFAFFIYGYNLVARMKSYSFPNIVRFVGNRMVLAGNSNQILVSASDWNFRGFSFNNCQVSSLNFNDNSPYLIQIEQTGGNVRAVESVNGVMLITSDTATYRVSGKERNSPPNASTAIISRLTNQITTATCVAVAENAIYMVNDKGLYKINYVREQDEGVLEELSLPVANLFREQPTSLVYSRTLDSLLICFPNQRKLLAFSLLTRTFYQVHVSIPYALQTFATYDGFLFISGTVQTVCSWDSSQTVDLVNINYLSSFTIGANDLSLSSTPTSADTLSLSPFLLQHYISSPNVALPAYAGQVRAVGSSFVLTESTSGNNPRTIFSCAVTKAIYTDKLTRGIRLRDCSVVLAGSGTARIAAASQTYETANKRIQPYTVVVDSYGRATITGEQNKAPASASYPSGDSIVVSLGNLGVAEAYAVACNLSGGVELVGFALDTAAKALSRTV